MRTVGRYFSSLVISLALIRTCSQIQQLLPLQSRCSLSAAMGNGRLQGSNQSLLEWRCSVGPHCAGSAQAALTLGRSQLRDVLSAFVIRVFSGHHLVPLAALFVQHVWDLQCGLSLCSQVQILLSKMGPQLPDFKLEEKIPQTDVM